MPKGAIERRTVARARTRLRPGKLIDGDGRHLADCSILDRSRQGVRVRLHETVDLAGPLRLLDEGDRTLFAAELVWANTPDAGLRLEAATLSMTKDEFVRAAGPYYAVR